MARLINTLAVGITLLLGVNEYPASADAAQIDNCETRSGAVAVDLSSPVDQPFLDKMKKIGITTIIRYYDHTDETIKGKTLRRAERDLILKNGFKIAVVFQHHNDQFSTFTPERGQADAERSLALAKENAQPSGSAIYFGVDGPWKDPGEVANIKAYFKAARGALAGSGYRIGVYGSGLMCRVLISAGLAELCWLANPSTWPEYIDYKQSKKWRLLQLTTIRKQVCAKHVIDFNTTNAADADFGQFGP